MSDGSYKLLLRGESNDNMKAWEDRIYERISWYNSQLQEVNVAPTPVPNAEDLDHSEQLAAPDTDPTLPTVIEDTSDDKTPPFVPSSPVGHVPSEAAASPAQYRQLVVELVKAKSLIGCTKNGLSSPLVTLQLLGHTGKEIPNESASSHIRSDTTHPTWEQVFIFGSKDFGINVSALGMPSLLLEVHHKPEGLVVVEKPMGKVLVPLSAVNLDGSALEEWFPLEKSGRMVAVSGELRLKLKWIKLPADKAKDAKEANIAGTENNKKSPYKDACREKKGHVDDNNAMALFETDKLYADFDPNELVVTVFRCQNLRWTKKKGLPDPIVNLKINEAKKQWNIATKTTNPVYNDTYFFKVKDPSMSLTVSIEYNELVKNQFVGQTVISLRPLQNKQMVKQWYKLRNMYGQVSAVDLGNVELGLVWRYNPDMATKKPAVSISLLKGLGMGSDSDTDVSDDNDDEVIEMLFIIFFGIRRYMYLFGIGLIIMLILFASQINEGLNTL
jgi:hypothetical protein